MTNPAKKAAITYARTLSEYLVDREGYSPDVIYLLTTKAAISENYSAHHKSEFGLPAATLSLEIGELQVDYFHMDSSTVKDGPDEHHYPEVNIPLGGVPEGVKVVLEDPNYLAFYNTADKE